MLTPSLQKGHKRCLLPWLTRAVRVTSARRKTVDGVTEREVVSGDRIKRAFHDDGSACVARVGHSTETLWVTRGIPPPPQGYQRRRMEGPPHNPGKICQLGYQTG